MRAIILLGTALLGACTVQKKELKRPYVVMRIDSPKPAAEFAGCAATAMSLKAKQKGGAFSVTRTNSLGVRVARWDFVPTLSGSQAELRAGSQDEADNAAVRGCAV